MSITICIGRPTIDKAARGEPVEVGQGVTILAADDLFHASPYSEIERLRAALRPFAECKTTSTGDRDDRHWQCLVSAQHLSDARDALGLR